MLSLALLLLLGGSTPATAQVVSLQSVLQNNGLTASSYNWTFPTTALNSGDAYAYIQNQWVLTGGKVDFGASDLAFTADPSTVSTTFARRQQGSTSSSSRSSSSRSSTASRSSSSSSSSSSSGAAPSSTSISSTAPITSALSGQPPVFRVQYPAGSFSKATGGTQFYSQPLNASTSSSNGNAPKFGTSNGQYERMLLAYDVWFPTGYSFNQGGKLPGMRGGPDRRGCSGGANTTDGTGCFSTRLMWRSSGAGEVYAYIPTSNSLCSSSSVICNADSFGTSLSRGSFSFVTGQWQTIWLMVILNQVGTSNGVVQLWYNGIPALTYTNLEIRSAATIESIGGLYFSTFFGGDDSSWASPTQQFTYFKNMQLFAGFSAFNGTGATTKSAAGRMAGTTGAGFSILAGFMVAAVLGLGSVSGICL